MKDHWHVDARQEWDQVLRDSGLVRTVHVDASKNLSDIFTTLSVFMALQADDATSTDSH